jgi:hypothetical protein
MAELPHTFPFPSRTAMLVNLFLYASFAVLIPVEVGTELLYVSLGNWMGLALWACAIVNGALAIVWLRYFDRVRGSFSR